jgi:hypothetical protein
MDSEPTAAVTDAGSPVSGEPDPGFLGRLIGIYTGPSRAFAAIVRVPRFWAPLLALLALNAGFTGIWMAKIDPVEFMKAQDEENARIREMPSDQKAALIEKQVEWFRVIAWLGALLGAPLLVAVVGGILLFVFRFVYGSEVTAGQAFSVTAWVFLAIGLVQTPLMLLTLFLKGDWNLNPQDVFQMSAALALDKQSVPRAIFSLAGSLDLLSFWAIALLTLGFARASKVRTALAFWGILVPWLLVVAGKAAFVAIFS